MEESRGETFTWNELKEKFLKYFKFLSKDELLVEASKQIKEFLQLNTNNTSPETRHNRSNAMYHNIRSTKILHSTRLRLETKTTIGKSFQWKTDHPETSKSDKTVLKIETTEKEDPERLTIEYFPPAFSQFKEGS